MAQMSTAWKKHRAAYLMCLPTIVLFLVYMLFPIGYVIYTSMLSWDGINSVLEADFIWLDNYVRLMQDEFWWTAVSNTLLYAFLKLVIELPLALILAVTLNS